MLKSSAIKEYKEKIKQYKKYSKKYFEDSAPIVADHHFDLLNSSNYCEEIEMINQEVYLDKWEKFTKNITGYSYDIDDKKEI